jgi:hypothetical protein
MQIQCMKKRLLVHSRKMSVLCGLLLMMDAPRSSLGDAPQAALAAFHAYTNAQEERLVLQHQSDHSFLASISSDAEGARARLKRGELVIEPVPGLAMPKPAGAMLHHWRGTAFAPGAKAGDFERLMRNFDAYPQYFSPEVVDARVLHRDGDRMQAWMRIRQRHVITVVMDTTYDVAFKEVDSRHGFSISRSTRISEIGSPGTAKEHALNADDEHGFLWGQNTYWSYEERDGGLYLQIESISLTRAIPSGLGWAIGPYVESIPRESLEFTLRSACNALRK